MIPSRPPEGQDCEQDEWMRGIAAGREVSHEVGG